MKYFNELPDMECLSGDTLPEFHISPSSGSFSGCSMELILAKDKSPTSAVICKECTPEGTGFRVKLTSEETAGLAEGIYYMHFRLIGTDSLSYRKLYGRLYVHKAAKGGL